MAVGLSIVIPTYNRLWALPKAIESCRTTRNPHEIIVIDDGSTDGTADWLAQQNDLVYLRTDNWGKAWAVNKAFALARGDYVRFLDSDDWLESDANDGQLEIARRSGADVVVAGYRTYDERTAVWVEIPWVPCDDFMAQQLGEVQPSHYSAFLFKRTFVSDIPHRLEFLNDRMFILEVALRQPRLAAYDKMAFVHLHHGRGRMQSPTSVDLVARHIITLKVYKKILAILAARGELTERRKRAPTRTRLWPLAHDIARYDRKAAIELVRWIRELDPDFVVPGSGLLPMLYRTLGFEMTTSLLQVRRLIMPDPRAR